MWCATARAMLCWSPAAWLWLQNFCVNRKLASLVEVARPCALENGKRHGFYIVVDVVFELTV